MNTAGDSAEQIVKMSLNGLELGLKISGAAAKQLSVLIYAILRDQKKTRGKAGMNTMLRSGKEEERARRGQQLLGSVAILFWHIFYDVIKGALQ